MADGRDRGLFDSAEEGRSLALSDGPGDYICRRRSYGVCKRQRWNYIGRKLRNETPRPAFRVGTEPRLSMENTDGPGLAQVVGGISVSLRPCSRISTHARIGVAGKPSFRERRVSIYRRSTCSS